MIRNYLKTGLPIYDALYKQARYSCEIIDGYKLYAPAARLLPFQFRSTSAINPISAATLMDLDGNVEADMFATYGLNSYLQYDTCDGYNYCMYLANDDLDADVPVGNHYIKFTDTVGNIWYSEVFYSTDCPPSDSDITSQLLTNPALDTWTTATNLNTWTESNDAAYVTNALFTNWTGPGDLTNWTEVTTGGGTVTEVSSGVVRLYAPDGDRAEINQTITLTNTYAYGVVVKVNSITNGSLRVYLNASIDETITTAGQHVFWFTSGITTDSFILSANQAGLADMQIDYAIIFRKLIVEKYGGGGARMLAVAGQQTYITQSPGMVAGHIYKVVINNSDITEGYAFISVSTFGSSFAENTLTEGVNEFLRTATGTSCTVYTNSVGLSDVTIDFIYLYEILSETLCGLIGIQWSNDCNIDGVIYDTGYEDRVYLEKYNLEPQIEITRDTEEISGEVYDRETVLKTTYSLGVIAPEFLYHALSRLQLMDNPYLYLPNGEECRMKDIEVNGELQTSAGLYHISIEFRQVGDELIKTGCCDDESVSESSSS